jgi:hypothetical protein
MFCHKALINFNYLLHLIGDISGKQVVLQRLISKFLRKAFVHYLTFFKIENNNVKSIVNVDIEFLAGFGFFKPSSKTKTR